MPMRCTFSAACLSALALGPLPAAAQEEATGEVARRLSDPANQIAATVALTAITEALLDIRIEPMRRLLATWGDERAAHLPPDARLRDLAGPEADDLPGEIGRQVPRAMGTAAGAAGAIEAMLPELAATAERLKRSIPQR